ncbi:hypothetical protein K1T71_006636 [Dendrolimus kikuchii]|uniref:Uncharacterized protein n=1 Tax=Dendrolimus kikuchii TaxID=765133 RepID=A0ACC1D2F2_9NEOP|nr:hypothetical protein K1T71_006636 [Dendrolimus kikuchii]
MRTHDVCLPFKQMQKLSNAVYGLWAEFAHAPRCAPGQLIESLSHKYPLIPSRGHVPVQLAITTPLKGDCLGPPEPITLPSHLPYSHTN